MPNGHSLHIGLNHVDPTCYKGWAGTLSGCENDAHAMQDICTSQGFATRILINEQATAAAVLSAISDLAANAASGDTVIVSYSGHGGQVPDTTGTEDDGLCETWVCYDRMVVDKELYAKWSAFQRNVHVEVYSDSCHSGTVIRELIIDTTTPRDMPAYATFMQGLGARPPAQRASAPPGRATMRAPKATGGAAYHAVYGPAITASTASPERAIQFQRMIPTSLAYQLFREQPLLQRQLKPGPIQCGVVLISGCQDNQTSADGDTNGLFTEKLLIAWDHGGFNGTIPQFHQAILAMMPSDQTPNYDLVGLDDDVISNGRPLTVLDGPSVTAVDPQISGPATITAGTAAPVFQLTIGVSRSGIVEVTTDSACFANAAGRTAGNFYGSWSDSARLHDGPYALPDAVWSALGSAGKLYYRAGSSSTEGGWDDYRVSTTDAQAAIAPFIAIAAAASSGTSSDSGAPRVQGPQQWSRSSDTPPTLTVSTSAPYHVVEVATQVSVFADDSTRSADNFYATWQDQPLLTDAPFALPAPAWQHLRSADRLYYRTGSTTSPSGWTDYRVSTPDADAAEAPFVTLTN